jgi:hypothetical protein
MEFLTHHNFLPKDLYYGVQVLGKKHPFALIRPVLHPELIMAWKTKKWKIIVRPRTLPPCMGNEGMRGEERGPPLAFTLNNAPSIHPWIVAGPFWCLVRTRKAASRSKPVASRELGRT